MLPKFPYVEFVHHHLVECLRSSGFSLKLIHNRVLILNCQGETRQAAKVNAKAEVQRDSVFDSWQYQITLSIGTWRKHLQHRSTGFDRKKMNPTTSQILPAALSSGDCDYEMMTVCTVK